MFGVLLCVVCFRFLSYLSFLVSTSLWRCAFVLPTKFVSNALQIMSGDLLGIWPFIQSLFATLDRSLARLARRSLAPSSHLAGLSLGPRSPFARLSLASRSPLGRPSLAPRSSAACPPLARSLARSFARHLTRSLTLSLAPRSLARFSVAGSLARPSLAPWFALSVAPRSLAHLSLTKPY